VGAVIPHNKVAAEFHRRCVTPRPNTHHAVAFPQQVGDLGASEDRHVAGGHGGVEDQAAHAVRIGRIHRRTCGGEVGLADRREETPAEAAFKTANRQRGLRPDEVPHPQRVERVQRPAPEAFRAARVAGLGLTLKDHGAATTAGQRERKHRTANAGADHDGFGIARQPTPSSPCRGGQQLTMASDRAGSRISCQ